MMSEQYTVGQYLVDRLAEIGVEHLFSIPGDYTLPWVTKYVPTKIKVISEVNELNAGYAADGYARQKGYSGVGALCVTYSAGALSAANPIGGAYVERVPVVLINGAPSMKRTLTFEQTGFSAHHLITGRQSDLQVFEYITAAAVRIEKPHMAPLLIDYALTQCTTERRPVYIELCEDMVDLPCERPNGRLAQAADLSDPKNLSESLAMIKARLETAKNPVIWVGTEIDRYGLEKEAAALIRELNVPFVTQLMSKAVISENHPNFAGVFDGLASSADVQALVKGSDFILALGVWLTDINTLGWPPDLDKTAFISRDTVKFQTYFGAQVSLEHFIAELRAAGLPRREQAIPQVRYPQAPETNPDDSITYQGFYDYIPRHIDDNTLVGADASLNYFGSLLLKVGAARGYFAQPSYSSIGFICGAATGISLAKGENQRVMIFTGDGGYQMTALTIVTQTRYKLNPIIFVIDNGVFAVEQWLHNGGVFVPGSTAPFEDGLEVERIDYTQLAKACGCKGWKAETYRDLEAAIQGALQNTTSPSIIQVVVPPKSIPTNAAWKKN